MSKGKAIPSHSRRRERLCTAYHEAGHAVLGTHLGRGVMSAEIFTGDARGRAGCVTYQDCHSAEEDVVTRDDCRFSVRDNICRMAGEAAEKKYLRKTPNQLTAGADERDIADRMIAADLSQREMKLLIPWLRERTRQLVARDDLWRWIQAVAQQLDECGSVSAEMINRLRPA